MSMPQRKEIDTLKKNQEEQERNHSAQLKVIVISMILVKPDSRHSLNILLTQNIQPQDLKKENKHLTDMMKEFNNSKEVSPACLTTNIQIILNTPQNCRRTQLKKKRKGLSLRLKDERSCAERSPSLFIISCIARHSP